MLAVQIIAALALAIGVALAFVGAIEVQRQVRQLLRTLRRARKG